MRAVRLSFVFALTAALCSPGLAASTAPPASAGDVLVTNTLGGFSLSDQPGYTLRFGRDGVASFDGVLEGRDGHYEADLSTANSEAVHDAVAQAHLCDRNGIGLFNEALMHRAGASRPAVVVELTCGSVRKTFNNVVAPDLPDVARTLVALGKALPWQYLGPARRETGVRFAR